jgi:hypothetical protein
MSLSGQSIQSQLRSGYQKNLKKERSEQAKLLKCQSVSWFFSSRDLSALLSLMYRICLLSTLPTYLPNPSVTIQEKIQIKISGSQSSGLDVQKKKPFLFFFNSLLVAIHVRYFANTESNPALATNSHVPIFLYIYISLLATLPLSVLGRSPFLHFFHFPPSPL